MGGVDTLRGCAFQIVQTVSDIVELLPDPRIASVRVESPDDDVVDYETLDADGRRLACWQAKTRQDADSWGAVELAAVLVKWAQAADAKRVDFTFVTDGRLGTTGQKLDDLIAAVRENPDPQLLTAAMTMGHGSKPVALPSVAVLQRVRIRPGVGSSEHTLAVLERNIQRLLERSRLATTTDAENAANRLFRLLFVRGGEFDVGRRTFSRAELLAVVGLDESDLSGGVAWSDALAAQLRYAVAAAGQRPPHFLPLEVVAVSTQPAVLRLLGPGDFGGDGDQRTLSDVLDDPVVVLVGATGQGKTTSLNQLAVHAANEGMIPIRFAASGHVAGALERRIRNIAEDALAQQLSPGAFACLLAAPGLLLLIDGISEIDDEARDALRADLQHLAVQRPLRIVATARDLPKAVSVADAVAPPRAYQLTPLDRAMRREIVGRLPGLQSGVVDDIEARLGDAVDNPMLFMMALSVSGDGVPESRAAVYEQFLHGLVARSGRADADDVLTVLGTAWAAMIGRDQRAADRYT